MLQIGTRIPTWRELNLAALLREERDRSLEAVIARLEKEKHLSDIAFLNQNARGK